MNPQVWTTPHRRACTPQMARENSLRTPGGNGTIPFVSDLIGRQLGDYRLLEKIGAGGMGIVFLAENIHHKKSYALKVLPDSLGKDVSFRQRFLDEARVMAELEHPGIVRVHHMGEDQGTYYLVMDYVSSPDGKPRSLYEELGRNPKHRIAPDQAYTWTIQMTRGLAYAHQRGVIHRDIKPANLLIGSDGRMRITDFGLVKVVGKDFFMSQIHEATQSADDARSHPTLTLADSHRERLSTPLDVSHTLTDEEGAWHSTATCGTREFMAPELLENREATRQSDLYALGVTIYTMLTGRHPRGIPTRPSRLVPGLPKRWDIITRRCLADRVEDRYQTAEALLADLSKMARQPAGWMMALAGVILVVMLAGLVNLKLDQITEWIRPRPVEPPPIINLEPKEGGPKLANPGRESGVPDNHPVAPVVLELQQSIDDRRDIVGRLMQILKDHSQFGHVLREANERRQRAESLVTEDEYADALTVYADTITNIVATVGGEASQSLMALSRFPGAAVFTSEIEPIKAEKERAEVFRSEPNDIGAVESYLKVIGDARQVLSVLKAREGVLAGKEQAEAARSQAEQMEAHTCICPPASGGCACFQKTYRLAQILSEQGRSNLEHKQFDAALESWQKARTQYEEAIALAQRGVQEAREQWQAALQDPLPERLRQFADEAQEEASNAEAAERDARLATAIRCYRRATRLRGLREELSVPLGEEEKLALVFIPKGEFQMGSSLEDRDRRKEEHIRHNVAIGRGFYIGTCEVTQAQYIAVMGENPSAFQGATLPVDSVCWEEAEIFCTRLSAQVSLLGYGHVRLPTEQEWEYACRAGTRNAYCAGDGERALRKVGWYKGVGTGWAERTKPIKQFDSNRWGLYDMHGNVWEWCRDAYAADPVSDGLDPNLPDDAGLRVARGGSWNTDSSYCRSASRQGEPPETKRSDIGFRVVLDVK